MAFIVPTLLTKTKATFQKRLTNAPLRELASLWQVDILDGSMFGETTWANPAEVAQMGDLPKMELDLMVQNPLPIVRAWHEHIPTLQRAIIEAEIERPIGAVIAKIRKLGLETGIAVNPETALKTLQGNTPPLDVLLIRGGHPGKSGQPFLGDLIVRKVEEATRRFPETLIAVDGGVNLDTAPALIRAGAKQLSVGSAIWKSKDTAAAYRALSQV